MSTLTPVGSQNGTQEQIDALEESFNAPHCETRHDVPEVKIWAGECTHTPVAILSYCEGTGPVCSNTVKGYVNMNKKKTCHTCGKSIKKCWGLLPL